MKKSVLSHAGSFAIHVGRAMVVRHVPGVHGEQIATGDQLAALLVPNVPESTRTAVTG
jgi:hypothetical protein